MTLHGMTVMLTGLIAGYLADLVAKRRGYGMLGDMLLGVGGSLAAGALFNVVAAAPGREWLPTAAASFIGAGVLLVGQRALWPAPPWPGRGED